jgi:signal transduction histidine kinase/CheY-like chemotaxis protein
LENSKISFFINTPPQKLRASSLGSTFEVQMISRELTVDECSASARFRKTETILALVVCGGFAILFAALLSQLAPIFTSIRAAAKLVTGNEVGSASDVQALRFLPVRELAAEALRAKSLERDAALAQMTQMMAHDIRKPFTMLKMAFDVLADAESLEDVRELTQEFLPEIQSAMNSADGLIQDVMEFSSKAEIHAKPTSVRSLLEGVFRETFAKSFESEITLVQDLTHIHKALVENKKIARVFSNIITNAVQAMCGKGTLCLRTQELQESNTIVVSIENTGSHIPKEDLGHLFESFFTKGKAGGTGLGLAICKKIILAHGGKIWVESMKNDSYPNGMVVFHFSIPASSEQEEWRSLPTRSSEYVRGFGTSSAKDSQKSKDWDSASGEVNDPKSVFEVVEALKPQARNKLKIALIDDEFSYREGLKSLLKAIPEIETYIEILTYENCPSGGTFADLIVLDVDMGDTEDGFSACRRLRNSGDKAFICIHSNRILPEDLRRAVDAGADMFLPKPLSRSQMLKVLTQAASRRGQNGYS